MQILEILWFLAFLASVSSCDDTSYMDHNANECEICQKVLCILESNQENYLITEFPEHQKTIKK